MDELQGLWLRVEVRRDGGSCDSLRLPIPHSTYEALSRGFRPSIDHTLNRILHEAGGEPGSISSVELFEREYDLGEGLRDVEVRFPAGRQWLGLRVGRVARLSPEQIEKARRALKEASDV